MCRFLSLAFSSSISLNTTFLYFSDINFLLHNIAGYLFLGAFPFIYVFAISKKESKVWKWKKRNFTSLFIHTWIIASAAFSHMIFRRDSPRSPSFSRSNARWLEEFLSCCSKCVIFAHLQLGFGYVDFAAINKLDDELEIGKCNFRRHDDDRMLTRILDEKLLEKWWACWKHHLK